MDPLITTKALVGCALETFIDRHGSTSTSGSHEKSLKNVPISHRYTGIQLVRQLCGELPNLPETEYQTICNQITTPIIFENREVTGYHPRIAQMLLALSTQERRNHLYRGKRVTELEQQIPRKCFVIPDFCFGFSTSASDIYLHFEVKRIFGLPNGVLQGCGFTCNTLKDRIELTRDANQIYTAYALASDGKHLGIAKIVINLNCAEDITPIVIYESAADDTSLPIDPLVYPNGEQSIGIKALYYLLRLTPEMLGHTQGGDTLVDGHRLIAVLGKGSFSTVYRARREADNTMVALKLPHFLPTTSDMRRIDSQAKINAPIIHELRVLQALQQPGSVSIHIPLLSNQQCAEDANVKWISVVQVGVPLSHHLADFTSAQQLRMSLFVKDQLRPQLRAAMIFAHSKGFGHCDIRPENIIIYGGSVVVLIDWGLACELEQNRHRQTGGLPFFHDEIVTRDPLDPPVKATAIQDMKSIDYVTVAAMYFDSANCGCHNYPWKGSTYDGNMIRIRQQYVDFHLFGGPLPRE